MHELKINSVLRVHLENLLISKDKLQGNVIVDEWQRRSGRQNPFIFLLDKEGERIGGATKRHSESAMIDCLDFRQRSLPKDAQVLIQAHHREQTLGLACGYCEMHTEANFAYD